MVEGGVGGGGAKGRIIAGAKGGRGGGSRGGTTTQKLEGVFEFLRASLACHATRRRGCSCGCRYGPHSRVVPALFLPVGDATSWGLGGRGHVEEEWGEGRKTHREASIVAAGAEGAAGAAAAAAGLVAVRCCARWGGLRLWGRHGRVVCLALHLREGGEVGLAGGVARSLQVSTAGGSWPRACGHCGSCVWVCERVRAGTFPRRVGVCVWWGRGHGQRWRTCTFRRRSRQGIVHPCPRLRKLSLGRGTSQGRGSLVCVPAFWEERTRQGICPVGKRAGRQGRTLRPHVPFAP